MQAATEVLGEVEALGEVEGEIQQIIYRETFSDNSNLKNYKITSLNDFYYREESSINGQADLSAEDLAAEEQTFCHYDEVCSRQKLCGDCAADEYEQDQYEEDWENYKIDSMCQDD
jgi:hypothetical protein